MRNIKKLVETVTEDVLLYDTETKEVKELRLESPSGLTNEEFLNLHEMEGVKVIDRTPVYEQVKTYTLSALDFIKYASKVDMKKEEE